MKTFILITVSMLFGMLVARVPMAQRLRQEQVPPVDTIGDFVVPDAPATEMALPPLDLDLKSFVDTLAEYDVVHETRLMTFMRWWGLTDPDTKTIYINDRGELGVRKETVLHEFVHAAYMRQGVQTGGVWEPYVDAKAQAVFDVIYGPKK